MPRSKPQSKRGKAGACSGKKKHAMVLSGEEAEYKARRLLGLLEDLSQPSISTGTCALDLLRLEETLRSLCALARNARAKSLILQTALHPLKTLLCSEVSGGVHQSCCDLAWSLCYHDAGAQQIFGRVGAVRWVVSVIRANMGNIGVVKSALGALSSLCRHPPNQRQAAEVQASALVVSLLKLKGFGDATLCQYAIDATASFSHGNAACADGFLKGEGAKVLVDALRRCMNSATFVRSVCILMVVLRERPGGPKDIVSAGAVEALLEASRQHLGMQEIQHILCALIGQLARDFPKGVLKKVWTQEGISSILQILCQFPKHVLIVEACTLLLSKAPVEDVGEGGIKGRSELGDVDSLIRDEEERRETEDRSQADTSTRSNEGVCLDWDEITMKCDVEGLVKSVAKSSKKLRPTVGRHVLLTLANLGRCGWMTRVFALLECMTSVYSVVERAPLESLQALHRWLDSRSMRDVTRLSRFVLQVVVYKQAPSRESKWLKLDTDSFSRAEVKQQLMSLAESKELEESGCTSMVKVAKELMEAACSENISENHRNLRDGNVIETALIHACVVAIASSPEALESSLWPALIKAALQWLDTSRRRPNSSESQFRTSQLQRLGWTVCTLLLLGLTKARQATLRILAQKSGVSMLLEARQVWAGPHEDPYNSSAALDEVLKEISNGKGDRALFSSLSLSEAVDTYYQAGQPCIEESSPRNQNPSENSSKFEVADPRTSISLSEPLEEAKCSEEENYSDTSSEDDPAEHALSSAEAFQNSHDSADQPASTPAPASSSSASSTHAPPLIPFPEPVSTGESEEREEDSFVDELTATRVRENDPRKRCFAVELPRAVYSLPTACEALGEENGWWRKEQEWERRWEEPVLVYDWRFSQGEAYGLGRSKVAPAVPYTIVQSVPVQEDSIEQSPLLEDYVGGGDCVRFESRFECGNLLQAIRVAEREYDLIVRSDINTQGHHQWFFFGVASTHDGVYKGDGANNGDQVKIRFNIINLTKPQSMFSQGMKPVHFSFNRARRDKIGWRRMGEDVMYVENAHPADRKRKYHSLSFTASFSDPSDKHLFAMCFPYSYSALQRDLHLLSEARHPYLHRSLLCQTLNGLRCDLLTITEPSERKKSVVVLTGRVHPGEVNASLMMAGTIRCLLGASPIARALRREVVLKVVPMLNPDGVFYGNTRVSLAGVDLNRQWAHPDAAMTPTVFHVKQLIRQEEVAVFVDFHGHSRKHNVFLYGVEDRRARDASSRDFAKMLSETPFSAHLVSLQDCSFHVHKGHDSAARVVVAKELGVRASFTLEASFCGPGSGPVDPRLRGSHFSKENFGEIGPGLADALLRFLHPEAYDAVVRAFGMDRASDVSDTDWRKFEAREMAAASEARKKPTGLSIGKAEAGKKKVADQEKSVQKRCEKASKSDKPGKLKSQDLPRMKRSSKRRSKAKPVACVPLALESNHTPWRLRAVTSDERAAAAALGVNMRKLPQRKSARKSLSRASRSRKQQRQTEAILHECSLSRFHTLLPLKPKATAVLHKNLRQQGEKAQGGNATALKLHEMLPNILS